MYICFSFSWLIFINLLSPPQKIATRQVYGRRHWVRQSCGQIDHQIFLGPTVQCYPQRASQKFWKKKLGKKTCKLNNWEKWCIHIYIYMLVGCELICWFIGSWSVHPGWLFYNEGNDIYWFLYSITHTNSGFRHKPRISWLTSLVGFGDPLLNYKHRGLCHDRTGAAYKSQGIVGCTLPTYPYGKSLYKPYIVGIYGL